MSIMDRHTSDAITTVPTTRSMHCTSTTDIAHIALHLVLPRASLFSVCSTSVNHFWTPLRVSFPLSIRPLGSEELKCGMTFALFCPKRGIEPIACQSHEVK